MPGASILAMGDFGTKTTGAVIDSAFVKGTSGDSWWGKFVAPLSQTSAALTLYALCGSTAGTVTNAATALVYNGPTGAEDDDNPGSTLLGTSSTATPVTDQWTTFTFSSVTLVSGATYYVIITNTDADPVTNNFAYVTRGAMDGIVSAISRFLEAGTDNVGFSGAAPAVAAAGQGPFVVKFSDGSIMGHPYTGQATHANATDDRGNRLVLAMDMLISGVQFNGWSANVVGMEINRGSTNLLSITFDKNTLNNTKMMRFTPILLSAGVEYDVVLIMTGTTTGSVIVYNMTQASPPADVQNSRPSWLKGHVNGSTSPGSYTLDETKCCSTDVVYLVDPAPRPTMTGGMMS
jgi:hypothetical protein